MQSCIYHGQVRHRRFAPIPHTFRYPPFMMYLDLDELPTLFKGRWLWSVERSAPARFRRRDHFGDPQVPLAQAVREIVERQTGHEPQGPIRLLTHLRYFGYCFNPVSFYFCHDSTGSHVETIVAEITNTPWGERYCYVLNDPHDEAHDTKKRYRFHKTFHVSPFMSMDVDYDWRFLAPGKQLVIHMGNRKAGSKFFDATLTLTRREISGPTLAWCLIRYPFMTR
jgi:DUF1365 family protein